MTDVLRLIERFHTTADLWATGVTLRSQAIRRHQPEASDDAVDALLNQWLQQRPGAEMGDGPQPDKPDRT